MAHEQYVIAEDEETGEEYLAELVDDQKRGHSPCTNPLVRIRRVIRYPNQRAIQHPEVALELPALNEGLVLRMAIKAADAPRELMKNSYRQSLGRAQKAALKDAANEREREIILRHMAGEYHRRRVVRAYAPWEVKLIKETGPG